MTSPQRFVVRMALFVIAVGLLSFFLVLPLRRAFEANVFLNGLIVGVLVLGVFYNFRQVFVLFPEVAWIERFRKNSPNPSHSKPPKTTLTHGHNAGRTSRCCKSLDPLYALTVRRHCLAVR